MSILKEKFNNNNEQIQLGLEDLPVEFPLKSQESLEILEDFINEKEILKKLVSTYRFLFLFRIIGILHKVIHFYQILLKALLCFAYYFGSCAS